MASQMNLRKAATVAASAIAACVLLTAAGAGPEPAAAATRSFQTTTLAPDVPHVRLTRSLARAELGRDLFGDPAGTALVGQVEIFDRYPYVRARYVQLVTDAKWNRILFGEQGAAIRSFDGTGTALGPLRGPAGIDRDPRGRIFVADAQNDRIVVLELRGDGADLRLEPRFAIGGFKRPTGVAWDGGATPLDPSDDRLWVADTGNHRIACYALSASGASFVSSIGSRGNGEGNFLEPRDVEVGRADGLQTGDLYVADWGNGRVVRLTASGDQIKWVKARRIGPDVRSVATDTWGDVYVAKRDAGRILKLDRDLEPIVESDADFPGLRDLTVGFLTVTDHRRGIQRFTGYPSLFAVESWSESSGAQRLELGLEVLDLAAAPAGRGADLSCLLTDPAVVDVTVMAEGREVRRENLGRWSAGRRKWSWDGKNDRGEWVSGPVGYVLRARSLYDGGPETIASLGVGAPAVATLASAWPNPAHPATQIRFSLPQSADDVRLDIVDVSGRVRRRLVAGGATAGAHVVGWNGTDEAGRPIASGMYVVRLQIGGRPVASQKLTLVR